MLFFSVSCGRFSGFKNCACPTPLGYLGGALRETRKLGDASPCVKTMDEYKGDSRDLTFNFDGNSLYQKRMPSGINVSKEKAQGFQCVL